MTAFVLRRLRGLIPLALLVTLIVFLLLQLVPGDPARTLAGDFATEEQVAEVREELGLNRPLVEQYTSWLGNAVQGDLGRSMATREPVLQQLVDRLPPTLSLAFGAILFALVVGSVAGVVAGSNRGRWIDRVVTLCVTGAVALPSYVIGMLLVLVFALWNQLLPATGYVPLTESPVNWARGLILPCIALGCYAAAVVARQLRSAMITVGEQDYIRTARSKGLRRHAILYKHCLKNAAAPGLTALGVQVSFLLGGAVAIERVFGINGIGQLAVNAVNVRDIPTIQGVVVLAAVAVVIVNVAVETAVAAINPRVRLT